MIRKPSFLTRATERARQAQPSKPAKPETRTGASGASSFSRSRTASPVALQDPGTPRPATTTARGETEARVASALEAEARQEALTPGPNDAASFQQLDHAITDVSERWRDAGAAAAAELDALAASGASIRVVEARAEALQEITDHPSFLAGMTEAQTASAAERAASASVNRVDAAFEEGDAPAAAEALRTAVENAPSPEAALAILEANEANVTRIIEELGDLTKAADGGQFDLFSVNGQLGVAFDRTLADLARAAELASQAPGGRAVLESLAGQLADTIQERGIGRFDEALGGTLLGGNILDEASGVDAASSALTMEVIRQLNDRGEEGVANDILQNVEASVAKNVEILDDLTSQVEDHNRTLARLIQDWGPQLNDEELEAAIEAFRASHPAYAQLEDFAAPALELLNGVHTLPPGVNSLGNADKIDAHVDGFIERAPDALANVENGHETLSRLLEEDGSILDRIADVADQVEDKAGYLEKVGKFLLNNSVAQALEASQTGDLGAVRRALDGLERQAGVFGLSPSQMESITTHLESMATASTAEEAAEAMKKMDAALNDLKSEGPFSAELGFGRAFRMAGIALGTIATVDAAVDLVNDPSLENAISLIGNASGLGSDVVAYAASTTRNLSLLKGGLATTFKVGGQIAGALGAGLSTYEAVKAFENGDPAAGSLHLASAAGAVIALAGSTGVGLAIAAGAGIALVQLNRVRASNVMENSHTEAFLQAAGLSSDVTHHLRNADSGGRSVGPVFTALAEHLGVEPRDFLQAVGQLDPDQVLMLVEAAHGVDPNDEGEFRLSADNDAQVGQPLPGYDHLGDDVPPHLQVRPGSIEGLAQFIQANGLELPGG